MTLGLREFADRLACPRCHGVLTRNDAGLSCAVCGVTYAVRGDVPVLLDQQSAYAIDTARDAAENVTLRTRLGRMPALLKLIEAVRPPHPFATMRRVLSKRQRAAFSRLAVNAPADAVFVDVGSGILGGLNADGLSDHIRARIVPLEIAPTAGVGVVGDAHKLPWRDASIDGLLIQGVLEHVLDPIAIAAEIRRVLKPGAPIYAEVPFLQHYHLDPLDFRRYTVYGFEDLFRDFEKVDSGVCAGPASALTDMLTEFPALIARSPALYWGIKWVVGWIVSPVQLLDLLWQYAPRGHAASGAVFYLGRRPQ